MDFSAFYANSVGFCMKLLFLASLLRILPHFVELLQQLRRHAVGGNFFYFEFYRHQARTQVQAQRVLAVVDLLHCFGRYTVDGGITSRIGHFYAILQRLALGIECIQPDGSGD